MFTTDKIKFLTRIIPRSGSKTRDKTLYHRDGAECTQRDRPAAGEPDNLKSVTMLEQRGEGVAAMTTPIPRAFIVMAIVALLYEPLRLALSPALGGAVGGVGGVGASQT